jgi:hypothetical protein
MKETGKQPIFKLLPYILQNVLAFAQTPLIGVLDPYGIAENRETRILS